MARPKGIPLTHEHKEKLLAANRGKKRGPHSAKVRSKISRSLKKFFEENPEARRHLSEKKTGVSIKDPAKVAARKRLRGICVSMLHRTLNHVKGKKEDSTYHLLGYTPDQLKEHLENRFQEGMSWENHGMHGWHVDHIRPISSFPIDTDPREINALENLRPLWAKENRRKYNKWSGNK